jgi:hypothetical protein
MWIQSNDRGLQRRACAVKLFNGTSKLERFKSKKVFFQFAKTL